MTKITVLTDTIASSDIRAMRSAIASAEAGYTVSYVSRTGSSSIGAGSDKVTTYQTSIIPFGDHNNYKKQLRVFWWLFAKYPVSLDLKIFFSLQFLLLFQVSLLRISGPAWLGACILALVLSPLSLLAIAYIYVLRLFRPAIEDKRVFCGGEEGGVFYSWLRQVHTDEVYVLRALIYRSIEIYHSCRTVVSELQPDIIHAHDLVNLPAAIWLGEQLGAKVIYDAHELETVRNVPKQKKWREIVGRVERHFITKADALITVSHGYAKALHQLYAGISPNVVYNVPTFPNRKAAGGKNLKMLCGLSDDITLAAFIGHLRLDRGIRIYLQAMAKVPDLHLVLCGPPAELARHELANDLDTLNLHSRVHFAGSIPSDQLIQTVTSADFSIIPTQPTSRALVWAMPNKFFESAFAGLVMIVDHRVRGMADLVKEYQLGVCTDSSKEGRLVADLRDLKENHKAYSKRMKTQSFIENYNWGRQKRVLSSVLDSMKAGKV